MDVYNNLAPQGRNSLSAAPAGLVIVTRVFPGLTPWALIKMSTLSSALIYSLIDHRRVSRNGVQMFPGTLTQCSFMRDLCL